MITPDLLAKINKIGHAYWVDRDRRVTRWEGEFVTDMIKRYERFGDKTLVSDKQATIINRVIDKLG